MAFQRKNLSQFEDEENQEVIIPDEFIPVPDLDLEDGEVPMIDEGELE